jgi:hypothetical protein
VKPAAQVRARKIRDGKQKGNKNGSYMAAAGRLIPFGMAPQARILTNRAI